MTLAIFLFAVYIIIVINLGWASRKTSEEGFMLAERRVRGPQLAATFSATFFDGATVSIYIAYVYQYGLSALSMFIGLALGFLLLRKYAGKIKAKADELQVYSMPEYFYRMFGKRCGLIFTVFVLVMLFALLIVNLIISGKILSSFFPIPYWLSVIIGGGVILSYLLLSGFKVVVKTDFFQLILMLVLSLGVAILLFGNNVPVPLDFDVSLESISSSIGFLILAGLGVLVTPDTWQRIFASNDQASLRRGLGYAGFVLLALGICVSVVGLAVRYAFPGIVPEDALVAGFSELLPMGFREIGLVLLYAVALSSSDTETFVISSVLTRDFKNYTKRYSEESMKKMARFFMVVLIILVSLIAIFYQDILSLGFSLASLNLALFPVVFGSLYWKLKESAVFWSLTLAFVSVLILFFANALTPETALISLPVSLFSLIIFQKIFKTKVIDQGKRVEGEVGRL